MDQFKKYLAIAIKYHFWIICGVMLLTALICWWSAAASLATQFTARKSKLEQAFTNVRVQPNHPNQGVIDKVKQQQEALKKTVYVAWEALYAEQKKNNPLPPVLSEDFKQRFENLNLKAKEDLEIRLREHYRSFIKKYLPRLQELVDARRPAEGNGPAAAAAGHKEGRGAGAERKPALAAPPVAGGAGNQAAADAAPEQELVGTVDWNKTDYETLAHEFEWTDTPSTLAIVMAQEDLWVYEALARVISRTNGKTTYANAAVKRINALEIGQNAAKAWRAAENSILATSASAPPGASASPPSAGGPPGPGGNAAADEERNRQQLMTERYVDDKGKPVPYMRDYPFAKHPCDEFKRMPIHLEFSDGSAAFAPLVGRVCQLDDAHRSSAGPHFSGHRQGRHGKRIGGLGRACRGRRGVEGRRRRERFAFERRSNDRSLRRDLHLQSTRPAEDGAGRAGRESRGRSGAARCSSSTGGRPRGSRTFEARSGGDAGRGGAGRPSGSAGAVPPPAAPAARGAAAPAAVPGQPPKP